MIRAGLCTFVLLGVIAALPAQAAKPTPTPAPTASPAPAATPPVILQQGFTGTSATGFIYGTTGSSAQPCLTASTASVQGSIPGCNLSSPDAGGNGALRLTSNSTNQSGFVIYNTALNESQGLQVIFDLFMYNGTGADGVSFFLIDGSYSPTVAGANGGSLGYAQKVGTGCCDAPGLVGGFIGIGFDSYGNYSSPTEGRVGGPGFLANTVAIRGAAATSYTYVTGFQSGGAPSSLPIAFTMTNNSATTRPTATRVRVLLSTSNVLTVDMDPTGTGASYQNIIPPTDLTALPGQPPFPQTFKFGWAASTGTYTNIHEVRNFVSTNAPPYLTITDQHNGTFTKGNNATYTIQATVNNVGGNADQPITVTDTIPSNETYVSASGSGWTCSYNSTTSAVTCTYPAPVKTGTALPPITLTVTPTQNNVTITDTACISSPDMYNPSGSSSYTDCANDVANIGGSSPLITIWKRITQIVRTYGYTTPQTIVPTPDPGSSPGLLGTASTMNIDPGDVLTYTVYFSNYGGANACGSGGNNTCNGGPTIQDLLSPNYSYQAGSNTFTCCSNPTSTGAATFSTTQQSNGLMLQWVFSSPLPPLSSNATSAVEGSVTYQVAVP